MASWWSKWWNKGGAPQVDADGKPFIDVTPEREAMMANSDKEKKGSWLTRWRAPKQQEQRLTALQEGFHELVGMTRAIREHMEQQAQTQKTLVDMMKHIPGAVEGLQSVGKATQQQTETLALLKKQLESSSRNEEHLVESMHNFNKTLTLMDELSKSTSQTVSSMADRTRDSEDLLRTILERSERRLIGMIVVLIFVTLTVLGVGWYIGLGSHFGHGPAESDGTTPVPVSESVLPKKSITDLGESEELPAEEVEAVAHDEGDEVDAVAEDESLETPDEAEAPDVDEAEDAGEDADTPQSDEDAGDDENADEESAERE